MAKLMSEIRGLRNNNPGNIERTHLKWDGMAADQSGDPRFIVFSSPEYGIRAMARLLSNYQKLHGLNTVSGLINRWADPRENNTASYIDHVASVVGVAPDEPINVVAYLPDLIPVMIKHENGLQPYSQALIKKGIRMA